MKNNIIAFLFLLMGSYLFSQKKYIKEYYNDGVLKEEGWSKNGIKTGYWTYYYKNKSVKKRGHFKNDLPIKYWYFYRKNGLLEKEGHFIAGIENNWWLYYDNDGNIDHKCQLTNNQKNGYCLLYKKNKLIKALRFSNNQKIKEWTDFTSFKKENSLNDLK